MGSDVKMKSLGKIFIKFFNFFFWQYCIVKSEDMKQTLGLKKILVLPNGVDLNRYYQMGKDEARQKSGLNNKKKIVLFPADPDRKEKNFELAHRAVSIITEENINLVYLRDIPSDNTVYYYNAANVLLLTSLWEGSPNVIKEAMACNCPIVSTNVGDVKWIIEKVEGCYITSNNPVDIANKIRQALRSGNKTNGRKKIIELGLDSESVAKKLKDLYFSALNVNSK
jgi:glycosyltransferase involved in cell wall biosynthesis